MVNRSVRQKALEWKEGRVRMLRCELPRNPLIPRGLAPH